MLKQRMSGMREGKDFWNKNVKRYYSIFKDWYKDSELYNYIGFLNFLE